MLIKFKKGSDVVFVFLSSNSQDIIASYITKFNLFSEICQTKSQFVDVKLIQNHRVHSFIHSLVRSFVLSFIPFLVSCLLNNLINIHSKQTK